MSVYEVTGIKLSYSSTSSVPLSSSEQTSYDVALLLFKAIVLRLASFHVKKIQIQ